jgi:threonine/homoserine/homoserine lactone efflux protein
MIDLNTLATYAAVVLGLFLIPGPAVLMTVGRAASGGRRVGVATGASLPEIWATRPWRRSVCPRCS